MVYTVRYAHLKSVDVRVGDWLVKSGKVGVMGNTGYVEPKPTPAKPNAGTHTHIDVIQGAVSTIWTLADMVKKYVPSRQECKYFIEDDIWENGKTVISNGWLGYENHYGFDIVNGKDNGNHQLVWNRSWAGKVIATGFHSGYGNYVLITYDTTVKTPPTTNETPKPTTNSENELKSVVEALNKEISVHKDNISTKDKKILELTNENAVLKDKIVKASQILK